jgi:hypothetical protein
MVLFTFSACAPHTPAAIDSSGDEAAIRSSDAARVEAYKTGDLEAIVAGYADDAVVMPSEALHGGTWVSRVFLVQPPVAET